MAQSERVSRTFKLAEDVMGVRKPIVRVSKKLVVFDMSGTLSQDTNRQRSDIYRDVGKLQGVSKREIERAIESARKRVDPYSVSPDMCWPFVNVLALRDLDRTRFEPMSSSELSPLGDTIHKRCLDMCLGQPVDPNMRWLLTYLRNNGVPMCLGSNHEFAIAEKSLVEKGLDVYFPPESRFVSERLGVWKPNPEFISKIAEIYKLTPEEIVYVGNSVNNDVPLVKSGCTVALIDPDGRHRHPRSKSRSILREYSDYIERGVLRIEGSIRRLALFLDRAIDPSARLARHVRS